MASDAPLDISAALAERARLLADVSVLYVEDEPITFALFSDILAGRVGALFTARDGREGLLAYSRFQPDIVVTDIAMPRMSGLEMIRLIRDVRPEARVVITTELDDTRRLGQAIAIGVSSYVVKPIDTERLLDALGAIAQGLVTQRELARQRRLTDILIQHLPYPVALLDLARDTVLMANDSARRHGILDGQALDQRVFGGALYRAGRVKTPERLLSRGGMTIEETFYAGRTWDIRITLVSDELMLVSALDVTERKNLENDLTVMATTDDLTGLCNRRYFMELAERETARVLRYATPLSLLVIDLDHFKTVNDTFGHAAGDMVLRELAHVLRRELREVDIVGRLGGEEFAVLLPETELEEARRVAERLLSAIRAGRVPVKGGEARFTASIGVTAMSGREGSVGSLLKSADKAMYAAKAEGRDRVIAG